MFYYFLLLLFFFFFTKQRDPHREEQLAKRASDSSDTQPPFTHRISTNIKALCTLYLFSVSLYVPISCTAGLNYRKSALCTEPAEQDSAFFPKHVNLAEIKASSQKNRKCVGNKKNILYRTNQSVAKKVSIAARGQRKVARMT